MKIWISTFLLVLIFAVSPARSNTNFTLSDYQNLKARDIKTAELVLKAMREAVYYAQESTGGAVICASPVLISGARLVEMFEEEIANPTNVDGRPYESDIQAAFVFIHALKNKGVCR